MGWTEKGSDSLPIGCVYRPPESSVEFTKNITDSNRKAREKIERGDYKSLILWENFKFPKIFC